jgi:hypothetical protein
MKARAKFLQFLVFSRGNQCFIAGAVMDLAQFLRIEQDGAAAGGAKHTVVHLSDPSFVMELVPDAEASDKIGRGVIKRICVPNSCIGDYGKYARFVGAAQEFFRRSFGEPVSKAEVRRFRA